MLFYLVHARDVTNALVFTKSAESAARLVRLVEFFEAAYQQSKSDGGRGGGEGKGELPIVARSYSSDLAPTERKAILDQFKNQEIHMWVSPHIYCLGEH